MGQVNFSGFPHASVNGSQTCPCAVDTQAGGGVVLSLVKLDSDTDRCQPAGLGRCTWDNDGTGNLVATGVPTSCQHFGTQSCLLCPLKADRLTIASS